MKKSLDIDEHLFGTRDWSVGMSTRDLAVIYDEAKEFKLAETLFKRAIAILSSVKDPDPQFDKSNLALAYFCYAGFLKKQNRLDEATEMERQGNALDPEMKPRKVSDKSNAHTMKE